MENSLNPNGLFNLNLLKDNSLRPSNLNAIRQLTQTSYQGNQTSVCRILGNFLCFVSTLDERIGIQLQMNGYWEIAVTETLSQLTKPNMKVLDVGSNYGYFSFLMAAMVGPDGHVTAIEANPQIHDLMKRSILINGFKNRITPINKAISDKDMGLQPFVFQDRTPMNGALTENKADHKLKLSTMNEILVDTTSIDDLFPDENIDLMKIDIEGSEEKLWIGSKRVREKNPNMVIVMEFNRSRYKAPDQFINSIRLEEYKVSNITPNGLVPLSYEQLDNYQTSHHMMLLLEK